jgi:hypothetical protein
LLKKSGGNSSPATLALQERLALLSHHVVVIENSSRLNVKRFAMRLRFWAVAAIKNSSCAPSRPPEPQAIQLQYTFEVSEEHFTLLPFLG